MENNGVKRVGVVVVLLSALTALILAHIKPSAYSQDVTRAELKSHGVIRW